ncbi:DNA/RNA non-specific endonuclease [Butyrivibrio sp. XPD2002]|uniref:DNA/RNA non-specific endonuclease n=1 Tax=Butyrivibrio sp. XPD2002 TaxID=1280665 RepID=UPI00042991C5|nr:DNA/RNA non-specific endonuclease [Butyrivibrio sp. XPD2002]
MIKRAITILVAVSILLSFNTNVYACNEKQSNTYVLQIIFGDGAETKSSDTKAKMLTNALYLCSEQSNGLGQDKINYLKKQKVSGVPSIDAIDVKGDSLLEYSHNLWEGNGKATKKQESRKKVLQNTVNKVFDFGLINNLFGSKFGKCNSFAAVLYYSHILADYLADDPSETEVNINGKVMQAYSGQPYTILNGDIPSFSASQKSNTQSFDQYSSLDGYGRAGVAIANIGPEIMPPGNSRQDIGMIKPSGWPKKSEDHHYKSILGTETNPGYLYNRCHLIAHQLAGNDTEVNLVTGTTYMNNEGMKPLEDKVADYVRKTGNHVLYRATPVYKGDNLVASGVQVEAYSVEDRGEGICFNRYCYNVQPGININYMDGTNEVADITIGVDRMIPFAVYNASDSNPDVIFEMSRHLEILFADQKDSNTYASMKNEITSLANEARMSGIHGETEYQRYLSLKQFEYRYFEVLKAYVPVMLKKEEFFTSAFK